ncbi:hypothetical protein [Natronosalvus rutilus]|uniref:Uncharacterized protein n=1 Tax=Natronosalvus rutilus TaxID=2953753 RepID=A0A9E7SVA8_9EURY|nr:hypothetical protein [Natronosalvus rutilus]UTF52826.1 hypothetical protein NGM29_13695 [Natronosalvus rutilus]
MESESQEVVVEENTEEDWRIKYILDFTTQLPDPRWLDDSAYSNGSLEQSKTDLANAYLKVIRPGLKMPLLLMLAVVFVDSLININPVTYGLALSIWASTMMVAPSLKSPRIIASVSDGEPDVIRRLQSEEMAYNNVGFALLGIGFILQIVGIHSNTSVIETAIITNEVSPFITSFAILVSIAFPIITPDRYHKLGFVILSAALGYIHFV